MGDILMTRIGDIGTSRVVKENKPIAYYVSLALIRPHGIDSSFLNSYIATPFFKREVDRRTIHVAFPKKINKEDIGECLLSCPPINEQKKIGHLLSLYEEQIDVQNKVIEDLKNVKNALCELFFDESAPNFRIGDVIEQVSERNKKRGLNNVLSVNNRYGFIEQSKQFEDRIVASEDTSNYKIVSLNDFAYNPARINVGSIARLKHFSTGIISPMYICFRTKGSVIPEYFESFFDTKYFSLEMGNRLEGSVRMCLSYEGLCNIPIYIPSLQEQKAISTRIETLKQKLFLEESILEKMLQERQYLLAKLFT